MATAQKRKVSQKRTVKSAAKSSAKKVTRPAAKPAFKAAQASQSAWTQQSAKLLPFAQGFGQGDVSEATDNMMRMGQDAMKQWWTAAQTAASNPQSVANEAKKKVSEAFSGLPNFSNLPEFDAAAAQEQLSSFARNSAEQLSKSASSTQRAMGEAMALSKENTEALVEVTNVAVALSKELGAELISFSNKCFSQNVELGKQALACRTLNDMFDLSSRFMKTNLDSFFSESVKLSELLFQASSDVSEPLNERITESSERLSKALAA